MESVTRFQILVEAFGEIAKMEFFIPGLTTCLQAVKLQI